MRVLLGCDAVVEREVRDEPGDNTVAAPWALALPVDTGLLIGDRGGLSLRVRRGPLYDGVDGHRTAMWARQDRRVPRP